ncbi:hypothetical protein [Lactobacillus kefiranofaciens]|uniref:DUF4145 domain-containing protein n=1 Tax=Lactobacillus kefiranofaciens TaxID=267818 RepID=A0AAX3UDE4_9LACO|nr:hypothetical protein [Lactobacillus kefiranofaciens]AEG40948.1 Hypothetical protein WANG_1253 [Lactobacillus kefiranofaciens subsp. kefiranofaciens]KRL30879.1 hypothetical protein FC94_GL000225 [Lactobacillus kefiranofaciens subsp. kefirgranum DSM 10550 = JCM 8572]KRM22003.1 hypothetical protein FC93_GL002163 [Lactobacillus kefiranofaciens subsp. kefiranofaciens DSM 5016 = JCM 6985]MCJ2172206.1 hypothetical protein [Lactobacillus kefiranofaciens]MCP9331165.1 hypothetical protein [Lactobacil
MEINFDFLQASPTFKQHFPAANKIHKLYTIADYRDVISNSRLLLEALTKQIFQLENLNQYYQLPAGEYHNLRNDTHYLRSEVNYPLSIMNLFDEVRRMGNAAVHDLKIEPDQKQAWRCLSDLHDILVFLVNSYDGKQLYYFRPDIAMEAQTDKKHYHLRKKAQHKPLHLHDHQTFKKTTHDHASQKMKRAKYFSSKPISESKPQLDAPTKTKESFLTKLKHFWHKK